jgi:hypothetical protein
MNQDLLSFTFADSKILQPKELAEYLSLLNIVVDILRTEYGDLSEIKNTKEVIERARELLGSGKVFELEKYRNEEGNTSVQIHSIKMNSPLDIIFYGCVPILTLAVIFSGGELEFSEDKIKAKLPSIGDGILSLKKALLYGSKYSFSYDLSSISIKLNKEEMELLMKQDPTTFDDGGYQRHLISLQYRVDRRTRGLVLSKEDLVKIRKHIRNYKKGGWQSRYKKIFERHVQ